MARRLPFCLSGFAHATHLFCVLGLVCLCFLSEPCRAQTTITSPDEEDNNSNNLPPTYNSNDHVFAMVSKSLDNPFFQYSHQACQDQARAVGATCIVLGASSEDPTGQQQAAILQQLVSENTVRGIAVAVSNVDTVGPAIDQAVQAGIPVVTFDSDAPTSQRLAYIGTDNYFFGQTLAKVLIQLRPRGGTYATISSESPNLNERVRGFQDELHTNGKWTEVPGSPSNYDGDLNLVQEQLHTFARLNPTAIVPVSGAAMRSGGWEDFVHAHRHRNITLVSGDAMANQLEFLDRGFAQGLVGQLPYEMGWRSIQSLYDIVQQGGQRPAKIVVGTNVLSHILIPLELPELVVDHNLIGNLHVIGYILFGLIAVLACGLAHWTLKARDHTVVKAAQPAFLFMVIFGVILMAASVIPLSFDDNGNPEDHSDRQGALYCMSVPWLGFCGFTLSFSALFSKTMRVNRIFQQQGSFRRGTVTNREILLPFFLLLAANVSILFIWSISDPLSYERQDLPGTDGWNRVIATYGLCQSDSVTWYLVPLAILNLSVLLLANWQAFTARNILSEFSESKYIGFTNMSLLQATLTGVPVLFVVRESPQAFYLILVFMIFVTCAAVLLLIFVPKIILADQRNSSSGTADWRPRNISAILRSSSNSTGERKQGSSSSSSRRPPPVVNDAACSSSTFMEKTPSDSGELVLEDSDPAGANGCFRKSSSVESKSVRWSEIESLAECTSQAGSSSATSQVVSTTVVAAADQAVVVSPVDTADVLVAEEGNVTSTEAVSDSSDSTVQDMGPLSVCTDSELSGVSSMHSSEVKMSGFRSSGASMRSSGLSFPSLAEEHALENDVEGGRGGGNKLHLVVEMEPRYAGLDDLPPLVSCTEHDANTIGNVSEAFSGEDSTVQHDDTSRRSSSDGSREKQNAQTREEEE
eukprot:scaffold1552_cov175-Amphora_coffeaeformis.AAC.10